MAVKIRKNAITPWTIPNTINVDPAAGSIDAITPNTKPPVIKLYANIVVFHPKLKLSQIKTPAPPVAFICDVSLIVWNVP